MCHIRSTVEPSSGSNVISRRVRPGLAGLRPHSWGVPASSRPCSGMRRASWSRRPRPPCPPPPRPLSAPVRVSNVSNVSKNVSKHVIMCSNMTVVIFVAWHIGRNGRVHHVHLCPVRFPHLFASAMSANMSANMASCVVIWLCSNFRSLASCSRRPRPPSASSSSVLLSSLELSDTKVYEP